MVQEEFEKIATDIRQRVIAVARGYRLDADSAEDVAQDTMLKLWTIREKTDGRNWKCAHANENLYAGFPHLYFYSNIETAANFARKCAGFKRSKEEK